MQLVQAFEDHSDAYLATAALKSRGFKVESRTSGFAFCSEAPVLCFKISKMKTTGPDKRLSGYTTTFIVACPPQRPEHSISIHKGGGKTVQRKQQSTQQLDLLPTGCLQESVKACITRALTLPPLCSVSMPQQQCLSTTDYWAAPNRVFSLYSQVPQWEIPITRMVRSE